MRELLASVAIFISGCSATAIDRPAIVARGDHYVAMGSSYAAGARMGPLVPDSAARCGRTQNNYAHLLAARLGLELDDVSCGGATTAHILGPWADLPPQIDALTRETKLVTLTIGGNDLNYVRNLVSATCATTSDAVATVGGGCQPVQWPVATDYQALERHLRQIAQEVRRRSPQATFIFVDYLRVLPDTAICAGVPLDKNQMAAARETFRHMAAVTKDAARAERVSLLPLSQLSKGHDACSSSPWAAGHPGKPADWHPTPAGHEAAANALVARLER